MSRSRIALVGQMRPWDEGKVSLPLSLGDPLGSLFSQQRCASPGLTGDVYAEAQAIL